MLKIFKLLILSSLLMVSATFAQPKSIQLEYEVSRNGQAFGTVKESYVQEGNTYRIVSTTKGEGFYALLGKRVLTSQGAVTAKGLVPSQFKLKRGDSERKSLAADFDWKKLDLSMLVKGDIRKAKLTQGAQDLASYPYQFMFTPPEGKQVKVALTTGKKLKQYTYNIAARDVGIKAAGASFKTLHLVNAEVDGKKKKELWLAPTKHYIPIKYLVVDKHGDKIEQILTKMSIQ